MSDLKISKKSIWSKIIVTALGSGASQIINFLFGIVLVRILSVEQYATYKQGNLILVMCMNLFYLISPVSLGYFFGKCKEKNEKKTYLIQTILSLVLMSFMGALMLYFCRNLFATGYSNPMLGQYFHYFTIIIFLETGCSYYTYYMIADNKTIKLSISVFVFAILRIIALVCALIFKNNTLEMFLIFYIISLIIKFVYIIVDTLKDYKEVKFVPSGRILKKQIIFSLPIMLVNIITVVNNNIDKNLVALLYAPEQYSIYVNGAFEIPFISVISTSIISVMLPSISSVLSSIEEDRFDKIISIFKDIIKICFLIIVPIVFAILPFNQEIVTILFSEKYLSSLTLFSIYIFIIIFKSLNLSVLITAADKQKFLVKNGIILIISNLVILFVIKWSFGFNYLTLAPVLSTLIMNILMMFDIKKIYNQKNIFNLIPISHMLHIFVNCFIVCVLVIVVKRVINPLPLYYSFLFVPLLYIIMVLCCIMTNSEFKNQLRGLINKLRKRSRKV